MTQPRTIAGLQWQNQGPSFWQLVGFPAVEVCYLGDGTYAPGQWFLFLTEEGGALRIEAFDSRDAACAMVAEAFAL